MDSSHPPMEGDSSLFYEMSRELPPYGFACVMVAFLSIATFNVVDILTKVHFTFRRRSGLYFWSILLSTLGIFLYVVGFIIKYFVTVDCTRWVGLAFIIVGWVPMVSGQSLALYSRLHLVIRDARHLKLRAVLAVIVTDAVLFHVPTCVLVFMAETTAARAAAYMTFEKVQVTAFTLQECAVSGLYIYEACTKVLKPLPDVAVPVPVPGAAPDPSPTTTADPTTTTTTTTTRTTTTTTTTSASLTPLNAPHPSLTDRATLRSIRRHLIYVNAVVVALDITLLGTQFADFYRVQTTFKPFVYSVKVKLEFAILNRLVAAVRGGNKFSLPGSGDGGGGGGGGSGGGGTLEDFRWPYSEGDAGVGVGAGEVQMGEIGRAGDEEAGVGVGGAVQGMQRVGEEGMKKAGEARAAAAAGESRRSSSRPEPVVLGREDSLQMAALREGSSMSSTTAAGSSRSSDSMAVRPAPAPAGT